MAGERSRIAGLDQLEGRRGMADDQRLARLFGVLFILTFVTSISAVLLFQPVLDDPAGYIEGGGNDSQIYLGAFLEFPLDRRDLEPAVTASARRQRNVSERPIMEQCGDLAIAPCAGACCWPRPASACWSRARRGRFRPIDRSPRRSQQDTSASAANRSARLPRGCGSPLRSDTRTSCPAWSGDCAAGDTAGR
jgi:hypothetical protein